MDLHDYPVNTNHLYTISTTSAKHLRHWSNIVKRSTNVFQFTGYSQDRFIYSHGADLEYTRKNKNIIDDAVLEYINYIFKKNIN